MRVGIHGAGIAIERVLNPPIVPPRRFRGLLDTVFTVALGSVCAFALTLGPAPLNTVAMTSAAAANLAQLEPVPASVPLATDEVEDDQPPSGEASTSDPTPENSPEPVSPGVEVVDNSTGGTSVTPVTTPGQTPAAPQPAAPVIPPAKPAVPPAKPVVSAVAQSAAVAIVEAYRTASGLPAFVAAETCTNRTVHSVVQVTPPALLPLGLAKNSLAAHPAFATVEDNGHGAAAVTIYACQ